MCGILKRHAFSFSTMPYDYLANNDLSMTYMFDPHAGSDAMTVAYSDLPNNSASNRPKFSGDKRLREPIALESATVADFGVHATVAKNKRFKEPIQSRFINTSSRSSEDSAVRSEFSTGSMNSLHSEDYYLLNVEKTTRVPAPLAVEPFAHSVTAEFIARKIDPNTPILAIPFPLPNFQMTQVRDIYLGSVSQEQLTLSQLSVGPVEPQPLFLNVKCTGDFTEDLERQLIAQATAHLISKCEDLDTDRREESIGLTTQEPSAEKVPEENNLQVILRGISRVLAERAELETTR